MNQVNKYIVSHLIGKGGCAEVYLAQDTRLQRSVALKKLTLLPGQHPAEQAVFIERFYQEARTTAHLSHPHILKIIDAFEENSEHYIVTDYIQGETLKNIALNQSLDLIECIDIFILIADAFAYAHDQGIIHRDIKPENIMLNTKKLPVIMDFGTAKQTEGISHTVDGSLLGTLAYMSPEQLYDSKNADSRSDIYSLGATLYEICTGCLPFEAESIAQLIGNIFSEPLILPHEKSHNVPPALSAVIAQALCKEPQYRFISMGDFKNALLKAKYLIEKESCTTSVNSSTSEKWEVLKGFQLMGVLDDQIAKKLTGSVEIKTTEHTGYIHFNQGQIQAVSTDYTYTLSPVDTLYEMALWEFETWTIQPFLCEAVQEDFSFIPPDILLAEIETCQSHYQCFLDELGEYLDTPIKTHTHKLSQTSLHQPRLKVILSSIDNESTLRKLLMRVPLDRLSILSSIKELHEKEIIHFGD